MCERCSSQKPSAIRSALPAFGQNARTKLWDIPAKLHCSIIGTCLSMADLHDILKRANLRLEDGSSDYHHHAYMVHHAGRGERVARLLHKALDERYGPVVRRCLQAAAAGTLDSFWAEAVDSGRIAGAWWALVSLREAPEDLISRAFGDVHMLSHFLGHDNRYSLQRLVAAERQIAELERQLDEQRRAKLEQEQATQRRLRELEAENCRLRGRIDSAVVHRPGHAGTVQLERRLEQNRRRLASERQRRRMAEERMRHLNALLERHPEHSPPLAMVPPAMAEAAPAPTPTLDVSGRCVLYVGGRACAVPHLRSVVERRQGRLLHHDGGLEQAPKVLEGLIGQADVVVCPIDCISHDACLRVKRLCQRLDKTFVPLRSSGASSFCRALVPS